MMKMLLVIRYITALRQKVYTAVALLLYCVTPSAAAAAAAVVSG